MGAQDIWADALKESESPETRDAGLWAKCFAEADGDENKAKAAYIRSRVQDLEIADARVPPPPVKKTTGWCPNCKTECAIDSPECPKCRSSFASDSIYKLLDRNPESAPPPSQSNNIGWCPVCHEPLDMDALYCAACKSNLSARNLSPLRHRPTTTIQPPSEEQKKSNWWKWAIGVPVGGFALLMIIGSCAANTPDGKERSNSRLAIELCWNEQSRKSLDPSAARFAASACEKMESDYRNRWGTNP